MLVMHILHLAPMYFCLGKMKKIAYDVFIKQTAKSKMLYVTNCCIGWIPSNNRFLQQTAVPQPEPEPDCDIVGPPDPDSNIRRVIYSRKNNRTDEMLDKERMETDEWNNKFWKEHNKTFFQQKKEFIERTKAASGTENDVSDNLSVFYKEFLEKNHDVYIKYNNEWYRKNFGLIWKSAQASLTKYFLRS